jgi:xanthine dehydrogenase iron-sulfur cluster and FAD-binding subunit A
MKIFKKVKNGYIIEHKNIQYRRINSCVWFIINVSSEAMLTVPDNKTQLEQIFQNMVRSEKLKNILDENYS